MDNSRSRREESSLKPGRNYASLRKYSGNQAAYIRDGYSTWILCKNWGTSAIARATGISILRFWRFHLSSMHLQLSGHKDVKKRKGGRCVPEPVKAAELNLRSGRAMPPLTIICWLPQDGHSLTWCYRYSPRVTGSCRPRSWAHCCPFQAMTSSPWWGGGGSSGLKPVIACNQPPMASSPEKPGLPAKRCWLLIPKGAWPRLKPKSVTQWSTGGRGS